MGAALHHWDNVKGLDKFLKISEKDPRFKTDPNKFNVNEVKKQYECYKDERAKLVTFAYIDAKFTRQKEKYLDEYLMLPTSTQKNDIELDKLKNLFNVKTRKDIYTIIKERREFNILKDESKKLISLNDLTYSGDVDAVVILDEIEKFIKERAVLPDGASVIMTLWILQTYFDDVLYTVSYLGVNAPERSCGKSRVLKLLKSFVKNGYQTTQISASTLYRFVEEHKVTLIVDECDSFIKHDKSMANALNAGYERGNTALKTNMENKGIVEKFDPFCAKVLCAINLHDVLPDTTISRTIVITMRKKGIADKIKKFRSAAILNPEHEVFKYLADIRSKLLKIAEDNKEEIKNILNNFEDDYCDEFFNGFGNVDDRIRDNYEFLVILAKLVGGEWYKKLQDAFKIFSKVEISTDNVHSLLLYDIYRLYKTKYKNQTYIKTEELIKALCELEESSWNDFKSGSPITPKNIAKLLGFYDIKPTQVLPKKTARGYKFKDFEDSFDSYCSHIIIDEIPDDPDPNDGGGKPKSETEPLSIEEPILDDTLIENIITKETIIESEQENKIEEDKQEEIEYIKNSTEIKIPEPIEVPVTTVEYEVVDNKTRLLHFKNYSISDICYGLDIETTGLRASNSEIALIQIYNPNLDKVFIYKVFDSPLTKEENKLLSEINFVAHNASFERSFMPYLRNLNCSMIAYHAATSKRRCSIGDLSAYTGITYNNKKLMQTSNWAEELTEEQLEYAAKDAKATYILWQKYKDVNKPVYDRMYTASFIIDDYARRGLPVDTEALRNLRIDKENKRDELLKKLTDLGFSDVITPNNNIRTKKEVMAKVTPDVMKIVEEVRRTNSLINNIIKGVEENIVDGRLPINVLICGTETGRLSTVNPNVQNFPRSGFRHIFKAREGYRFVRADFSGQELRMVAAMSNEKVLIEAFNAGRDPHAIMAARLNSMPLKTFLEQPIDWQKSERQKAKAANFGFLYGMGASRFIVNAKEAYNVDLTLAEANNIRTKFWATYSFLKKWSEKEREECKVRRYALTRGGRKRYFEDIDSAYCEMINTAVQGSCGEVLLETLIALPDYLKGYLVNTVHDELIFEVPIELIQDEARYTELKTGVSHLRKKC